MKDAKIQKEGDPKVKNSGQETVEEAAFMS